MGEVRKCVTNPAVSMSGRSGLGLKLGRYDVSSLGAECNIAAGASYAVTSTYQLGKASGGGQFIL